MFKADELRSMMTRKGLRATPQRIAVLRLLLDTYAHPTASNIFESLSEGMPTLTKATVYNCLSSLCEAGLAVQLSVDEPEYRYDALLSPHGHFRCSSCHKIENFPVDIQALEFPELIGCKILRKEIIFTGLCDECIKKGM